VTFAQTWDLSYGTSEKAQAESAAPVASASEAPLLVPARPGIEPADPPGDSAQGNLRQVFLAVAPEAAKVAREFTKATLTAWQLDEFVAEAVLIASELVTNAIRHGGCCAGADSPPVELAWQRQAGRVVCTVTDCNSAPPVLGLADQDAESGRGLQVVQAVAATWGWMLLGATSKAVWAVLTVLI
jgi:anti-sigma regulatory factor (Ser/Thr protein kinase)